jgi:hypothetical protein
MKFAGTWHIQEMDMWDEDYLNMEDQAYLEIEPSNLGTFQFGLVSGQIDGEISEIADQEIFYFSWEGSDEDNEAFGAGWCRLENDNVLEGRINFHLGDSSGFRAVRA